jgi:pimeloyl-ACP methyl ester carboxylesterase
MNIPSVQRLGVRTRMWQSAEYEYQFLRALGATQAGVGVAECMMAASQIVEGDPASWRQAWTRVGDAASARDTAAGLRAASIYYRLAEYVTLPDEPECERLWMRSRSCFQRAARMESRRIETIELECDGVRMPGYFAAATAGTPRPTLVLVTGFDGSAEELFAWCGLAALVRDYNVLAFEGPGQCAVTHMSRTPFRPDYERPIGVALDYALDRREVDPARIALLGVSWGGHFVLRAAALDTRVAACVASSPIADLHTYMLGMIPEAQRAPLLLRPTALDPGLRDRLRALTTHDARARWSDATFRAKLGGDNLLEAFDRIRAFRLDGLEREIRCPVLGLVSRGEGEGALAQAASVTSATRGRSTLRIFEDHESTAHCQVDNLDLFTTTALDWLDATFRSIP